MGCLGVVFPSMLACLGHMSSVDTRQMDLSFTTICSFEVLVEAGEWLQSSPAQMCMSPHRKNDSLYHREVGVTARQRDNLCY